MPRWYGVVIMGRYNGRPLTLADEVQAGDARDAVFQVVNKEYGLVGQVEAFYTKRNGRRVLEFVMSENGPAFVTDCATFEEMATEIVDGTALAKLNGDPVLPLRFE